MTLYIATVVEGKTEVNCVARLLRRIWLELLGNVESIEFLEPARGNRDLLLAENGTGLGIKIEAARSKLLQRIRADPSGRGLVFLLLDAEEDCPAVLAPRLLETARRAGQGIDIACALAKRMFENWIVAGASTLNGVGGLPDQLPPVDRFEDRSGAKWLDDQLRRQNRRRKYKKTVDARVFVEKMNLEGCRANSPSFDKLCRELAIRQIAPESPSE
jgi:hypothetical protein